MRKTKTIPGEYYHVYNRGNNKQNIFLANRDWVRFLFLVLYFQSPETFYNLGRPISHFVRHSVFNIPENKIWNIVENRYVELTAFALMPNHFHLLVKEVKKDGIPQYMQRIQNAYTKYFNTKYKKTGHLLQGPYKIVEVEDNRQILHLSAYIHRNCREITEWKDKENQYPWSSYQDFIENSRWEDLLKPEIIVGQFSNQKEYKKFVETSGTKELNHELPIDIDL